MVTVTVLYGSISANLTWTEHVNVTPLQGRFICICKVNSRQTRLHYSRRLHSF